MRINLSIRTEFTIVSAMNFGLLFRVFLCISLFGGFLYAYIEKQNAITKLRLEIPVLSKKVEILAQENIRYKFEIEQFENPLNLMELARKPEYSHLKHPLLNEIITVEVLKENKGL